MTSNFRLLIVDDDEETLFALKNYFVKKSYDTITASNGLEALKIIENSNDRFDILITDIVMPGVTGVALISVLKKKYPEMPVIAITETASTLKRWPAKPMRILSSRSQSSCQNSRSP